jgi:tetratricopeptide (TPR) repeat protein
MAARIAPALPLALFLFGAASLSDVTSNAPALNPSQQQVSITGDTRLRHTPSMYTKSDYYFQLGYGFVNADALSFDGIEGPTELATYDVAVERFTKARDYLAESLRHNPSNAYAWQIYAQALGATGDLKGAVQALNNSWRLAPSNPDLAFSRMNTVEALRVLTNDQSAHKTMYSSDKNVVFEHKPKYLDRSS